MHDSLIFIGSGLRAWRPRLAIATLVLAAACGNAKDGERSGSASVSGAGGASGSGQSGSTGGPCDFGSLGCDAPCPDASPESGSTCAQLGQDCFYGGGGASTSECDQWVDVTATCKANGTWSTEAKEACPYPECPSEAPTDGQGCYGSVTFGEYTCSYADPSCDSGELVATCSYQRSWVLGCASR